MRDRRFAAFLSVLLTLLLFAPTALAMTEERAVERVKAVDPTAVQAVKFWVYPDKDAPSWNLSEGGPGRRVGVLRRGQAYASLARTGLVRQ